MVRFGMTRLLTLAGLVLVPGLSMGQGYRDVGLEALEKQGKEGSIQATYVKLRSGDIQASPNDKDAVAALDYEAKWLTYRFTYAQFQGTTDARKSLSGLYTEFDHEVQSFLKNKEKKQGSRPASWACTWSSTARKS